MSIASELYKLERLRQAIVREVNAKGGELAEGTPLNAIPSAIEALPSGGGDYLQATLNKTIASIDMSDWNVTTMLEGIFRDCAQLADVKLPNVCEVLGGSCLRNCAYQTITLPASLTTIAVYALSTNACKTIVSLAIVPPTVASGSLPGGVTAVYVPDGSVDAYKTATQWSSRARYIYPLSELPQ